MITYVKSDIFLSPAKVLVNPVNTVGIMGKGLASEFKRYYPDMFDQYRVLCDKGRFDIGTLWLYKTPHKWVLNFPTKMHWRSKSKIEDIESGLQKFAAIYADCGITSVSFPMLGTGSGKLDWESEVRPLMEAYLAALPISVFVHDVRGIERRNTRTIGKWLSSVPQVIPTDKFWRDLSRMLMQQSTYTTLDTEETFRVTLDKKSGSRSVYIHLGNESHYISGTMFTDTWAYVRGAGYVMAENLPSGLDQYASFIFAILTQLKYVEPIAFLTAQGEPVVGIQYVPPATNAEPFQAILSKG